MRPIALTAPGVVDAVERDERRRAQAGNRRARVEGRALIIPLEEIFDGSAFVVVCSIEVSTRGDKPADGNETVRRIGPSMKLCAGAPPFAPRVAGVYPCRLGRRRG